MTIATPSNTITFGKTDTTSAADKATATENSETTLIKNLLAIHQKESTNDRNSKQGFAKGLNAFIKAIDMILKINTTWAYQILWDYFLANNQDCGSTTEGRVFRGWYNNTNNIDKYVALYNHFRCCTLGYGSVLAEETTVRLVGNPDIVLWAEAKMNSSN